LYSDHSTSRALTRQLVLVSFVSYLVSLQKEVVEVFKAVTIGDINTVDVFVKKYGVNSIRNFVSSVDVHCMIWTIFALSVIKFQWGSTLSWALHVNNCLNIGLPWARLGEFTKTSYLIILGKKVYRTNSFPAILAYLIPQNNTDNDCLSFNFTTTRYGCLQTCTLTKLFFRWW